MRSLKYKVIKSKAQYRKYAHALEKLLLSNARDSNTKDEIDLLTLLIETWDADHNTFDDADPVQILHSLMADYGMKARDLVDILHISKGYVSDILHYKKGLSKDIVRKLAGHFKLSQEAFNRPYKLLENKKSGIKKVISRSGKKQTQEKVYV
jgi:HTH-type transcriptional regulator/antitoxin HigA